MVFSKTLADSGSGRGREVFVVGVCFVFWYKAMANKGESMHPPGLIL